MKLAVCLHLHYLEQTDEFLAYLQNLRLVDYDLYVTLTTSDAVTEQKLRDFKPNVKVWTVAGRGYDIGPFVDVLHNIDLDSYDYVLKLHSKNSRKGNYTHLNGHRLDNALWREMMLEALLGSEKCVRENLQIMSQNPDIGLLASAYCLTDNPRDYADLLPQINAELQKMNFAPVKTVTFAAGTMFLVRTKLLKPLLRYVPEDFAPTDGKVKHGTLAHIVERLFGAVITAQGVPHLQHSAAAVWREISSAGDKEISVPEKITKHGKLLIKICKIPVYSRPVSVLDKGV